MGTSNGRFFLGLLLGLIAGAGLAHFLTGKESAAAKPASALLPQSSGEATPQPTSRPPLAPAGSERSAARALPASMQAFEVTDAELQHLMAGIENDSDMAQVGSGSITGKVLAENGDPLPGALIRLVVSPSYTSSSMHAPEGGAAPELGTLEEAVRRAAESFREKRASNQELPTDANGAYKFEGLPERTWIVSAYLPGYLLKATGNARNVSIGSEVSFTGMPVLSVPTTLSGPNGAVVEEATLEVKQVGWRYAAKRYKWTCEEPVLLLAPGEYTVTAYAEGNGRVEQARLASEAQEVYLATSSPFQPLHFDLRARLGIRGVLRPAKGDPPVESYYVHLMELAPEQELDLKLLAKSGTGKSVRPGSEYTFLELNQGRYAVGLSRSPGFPVLHHVILEVVDRVVRADLDIPPLDRSRYLKVRVLDDAGASVTAVKFNLSHDKETGYSFRTTAAIEERDGTYLVHVSEELADLYWGKSGMGETFELRLTHDKYGSRTEKLAPAQAQLTVTLSQPGTITATVAGYQGSGYEGRLSVSAKRTGDDPYASLFMGRSNSKVAANGTQVLEGLEPGVYDVSLLSSSKGDGQSFLRASSLQTVRLEVFAGDNTVQLSIPTLYSLRVHWPDGKPGTDLYLSDPHGERMFGSMLSARLDANGYGTWDDLKAGQYLLTAGSEQMEIRVPCAEVEFEAMDVRALRVIVSDPSGDLAKIGFVTGDLIIGEDGQEFSSKPNSGVLLQLSKHKGAEKSFLVLRDGAQIEIRVKSESLGGWKELGGTLQPATR